METLLRIGLSNAVAAVLLALVVAAVACVWRRPALLHALWLLVLLKLVTPPLLWLPEPWAESGAAAPTSRERERPENGFTDGAAPPVADAPDSPAVDVPEPADAPVLEAVIVPVEDPPVADAPGSPAAEAPAEPPPVAPAPAAPWWVAALIGLWLAGAIGWYALAVCRLRRFRRLLRHATPAPESLRQRTQRLAEKMRLRRCPAVWLVPGRVAPMLWAAGGRPCILFPSELLELVGVEGQNALLVHELAHLRRRDHWVRWLEFAAAGLYWWHPVLWFARRELREAEELCCDAWVTATMPGAGKTYAAALLETLDFLSDSPPAAPVLASGVGRVADLKRRLTMIMRGTTPKTLGWRGCLAVLGMGVLMLPLLPAWARAQVEYKVERVEEAAGVAPVLIGSDDGLQDNARAALKTAEAELEQKQAEVAALTAKVQQLRARLKPELKPDQAAPAAKPGEFVARIDSKGNIVVEVVGDVRYTALQDMLKQMQALQPAGPMAGFIVLDKATGKIIMKMDGGAPAQPQHLIMVPMGASGGTAGPAGGTAGMPPAAESDKRVDELEQRLKSILDEVEKLRRERKEKNPAGGVGAPAGSAAPVVTGNDVYLERRFTVTDLATQQRLKDLQAKAAEVTARLKDLSREADDLRAKMAQVEKTRDADAALANARVAKADDLLNQAETRLAEAQFKDPKAGEAVRAVAAQLEFHRALLKKAKEVREEDAENHQSGLRKLQSQLDDRAAECEKAQTILTQLQQEIIRAKSTPADGTPMPESKTAPKDSDEASFALSTADHYFKVGNYNAALKDYSEIAARLPKEEEGVKALGGCVRCLAVLGRKEEVGQRLQEIKVRLGVLSPDARQQWEKWLEVAMPEVAW